MKSFAERNLVTIGVIGVTAVAAVALGSLNYQRLPFFNTDRQYSAYFSEASGLLAGAPVQVSGFRVGQVESVELDGPRVLVTFKADEDVRLGDRTEAAVKTKSLLGAKVLDLNPRGEGTLSGPIPLDRTTPAYQLPDALGDLSATISGLNTDQLNESLTTLAETFSNTAPDLRIALEGTSRFAKILNDRDADLRGLLENASKATAVLAERSDQVVSLIANSNALLAELRTQSAALDQIAGNISALSQQVSGLVADNRDTLRPALDKLNGVLTVVDNRKERIQRAIVLLNQYSMSLGESVASGPYFKAILANLPPGQFIQPFVDAAFSDLGLDPNTLLPSEVIDPPIGQGATPPLPMPYPRTGQGGPPRLTIPDAITGTPEGQQCGPPGIPLPGPGCYPLREPIPAPPPGGPPPGPPAQLPPDPDTIPPIDVPGGQR